VVVAPKKMDEFDKLINDTKKPIVKDIDPRNFSEAELSNHIPSVSLLMVEEEKIEVDIEDEDDDFESDKATDLDGDYNPDDEPAAEREYQYGWGYDERLDDPLEEEEVNEDMLDEDELYARGGKKARYTDDD
jgi:hypothetical protein